MEHGWFKMDRDIFEDKLLCRDTEYLAVWCWLCAHAAFKERSVVFAGKPVILQPGQLITGRNVIAEATGVNPYKVQRILALFESAQRIAQQMSSKNRLITIVARGFEEESAQQNAPQAHSNCTTDAQHLHTIKNDKKDKKEDGYTFARRGARNDYANKKPKESVYSSDASYDLDAWAKANMDIVLNYKKRE